MGINSKKLNVQNAIAFINKLHGPPRDLIAPSQIDWSKAPSFFPSVGNQPRIEMSLPFSAIHWKLNDDLDSLPPLHKLSLLLWMSYGCCGVRMDPSQSLLSASSVEKSKMSSGIFPRRAVPSGGACYPTDLYLSFGEHWNKILPNISKYIYQYAAHYHSLIAVMEKEEISDKYPWFISDEAQTIQIFFSANLSRTAFKYANFAYRLSAVDLGVVLGRVSYLFGASDLSLHFDYFDKAVNDALRLSSKTEGVYAILNISNFLNEKSVLKESSFMLKNAQACKKEVRSCTDLDLGEWSKFHCLVQSKSEIYKKAYETSVGAQGLGVAHKNETKKFALEELNRIVSKIMQRESKAEAYTGEALRPQLLMQCLHDALKALQKMSYISSADALPKLSLYCAILNVSQYSEGLYKFNADSGSLLLIEKRKIRNEMAGCLHLRTANIGLSSFVIHIAGLSDCLKNIRGIREYRIQQMLVGVAIDAITLCATEQNLSAHTYLGFNGDKLQKLYQHPTDERILGQICVGVSKIRSKINSSMVF